MPHLRLNMLGPFQALLDGQALRGFASDKERALLATLALSHSDRPISRDSLIQMFWDGFTADTARHSLRNALYNLRKMLAPLDLLHTTRQTVHLNSAHPDFWCDALVLEQVAADESASLQQVQRALVLVHGDLLHGLDLRDCPIFTAWLAERRQQLAAQVRLLEEKRARLAAAQAQPPPGFLPHSLTPFFGREQELALLARKVVDPACGLVTIAGEGGSGKTRLALALGEQVRPAFPGGVWFVSLANLSPDHTAPDASSQSSPIAERLAAAIAARLSVRLGPGVSPVDQIVQRLGSPRLLLILDNFEHLHGAEPLLVDLLHAAPALCLLVTSRRRLDLQAEYAFRLGGLPLPPRTVGPDQPGVSPQELQQVSSIQLFVERADRRLGGFTLGEHNRQAVVQICQLVEGLPLGIELAAALVDQHSCAEIASAIAATVDILASNMADLAPRHRSLRAVFEYSWQLLSQPEQAALARCAFSRGGFSQDAAAAVAGASPDMLASLVDKSLLRLDDAARYDMHELLRQMAAEKLLDEPGAREATAARHCAYYAHFLDPIGHRLADEPALMQEAVREIDNVTAAWQIALHRRDLAALRQLVRGVTQLWYSQGRFQQGGALMAEAEAALRAELDCAADVPQVQAVLGLVLLYRAYVADKASGTEAAIAQASEALQLGRSLGDGHLEADAVLLLGALYWTRGDMRAVEIASRRGLELAEQSGDNRQHIMALGGLSLALLNQGHVEQALALDEQALALAEASGRRGVAAVVLSNLGASHSAYGDFRKARGFLDRALQMRSENQERLGIGIVLLHSGRLNLIMGDVAGAQVNLEEALHLFSALGNAKYHAETLAHRALVFLARQAYEEARQDASAARDLAAGAAIDSATALAHLALARVWLAQGHLQPALDASQAALALARGLSDAQSTVAALATQAQILAAQGSEAAAREIVQQMLPLPEQISFHPLTGTVRAYLAASRALAADDPVQAQALLRHVHQRLLAAADTIDDPAARHTFLHDNPSHRQDLALMAGGSGGS